MQFNLNYHDAIFEVTTSGDAILQGYYDFTKAVLEIDADEITSYYEGDVDTEEYKLINIDGPLVEIESRNPLTNELERIVIEVRGETMWVPSTLVKFRELFVKILPETE